MQVEPPGPDLPDHRGPSGPLSADDHQPVGALRLSAALGAAALAIASNGNLLVLGGLLALAAAPTSRSDGRSGRALGAAAALLACTAVLVRWGAPSLSAAAGAQSVLGPAVTVGTIPGAASALFAALAIALLTPPLQRRTWDLVIAVCFGVVVGAVVAGPTLPNSIPVRLAGVVVGTAAAVGVGLLPDRRLVASGAFVCGALALLLASVA